MIANFFAIFFRRLKKQKVYSVIVIASFSITITAVLLISLYTHSELTYDSDFEGRENIYRLGVILKSEQGDQYITDTPGGWTNAIKSEYPEIQFAAKVQEAAGVPHNVRIGNLKEAVVTSRVVWTDANFAEVFKLKFRRGEFNDGTSEGKNVIISRSFSNKMFGTEDAIGKELLVKHIWITKATELSLIISGIYDDLSLNNHMKPDVVCNINALKFSFGEDFDLFMNGNSLTYSSFATYLRLREDTEIGKIETRLNELALYRDATQDSWLEGTTLQVEAKLLSTLHFDRNYEWEIEGQGDLKSLYILMAIALSMLLMCSFNFIGITTIKNLERHKEIGIRRALGGHQLSISFHTMTESLLYIVISYLIAISIAWLTFPYFKVITNKELQFVDLFSNQFLVISIIILLSLMLLSSVYPAVTISNLNTSNILRGIFSRRRKNDIVRESLVVVQITIALVLILSLVVTYLQVEQGKQNALNKLGDQIVAIPYGEIAPIDKLETLKNEIAKAIENPVTSSNYLPRLNSSILIEDNYTFPEISKEISVIEINADQNFIKCFGLEIIAGQDFAENSISENSFIINETTLDYLKVDGTEAIGMTVKNSDGDLGQIIGVVKDFPIQSIKNKIDPIIISRSSHPVDIVVYANIGEQHLEDGLHAIKNAWQKVLPDVGFNYNFITDQFRNLYKNEIRTMQILFTIALFALVTAFFCIYTISHFWIQEKNREAAIRRVFGATVKSIVSIFIRKFNLLFLLGSLIAYAIAGYIINEIILTDFAYKANLSLSFKLGIIFTIYLITFLIVFLISLRVTKKRIMDALKND